MGNAKAMPTAAVVSVVTPTYNRAHLLERVFESLAGQTFRYFEWIVVDDGSTDETKQVVERLARRATFAVRYFWKPNGGKHTAMNLAYTVAAGELLLCFDSDDRCTTDALAFMVGKWRELSPRYPDLIGIVTSSMTKDGMPIGTTFPIDGEIGHLHRVYDRIRLRGDRWDIHMTRVLREYPFPTLDGQRLCPEGLVWNRLSRRYRMAFFNHRTRVHEHEADGYTANLGLVRRKSAGLFKLYYDEFLDLDVSLPARLKAACNFVRASVHDRSLWNALRKRPHLVSAGLLIGVTLALRDIIKGRLAKGAGH